ncbi:hypothetical protein BGZ99_001013 [Dissophora globulifera]|uniref:Spore coat protein CotH n=1 Tax=Dissophora globulifera TaxID=979702 RepID=A0A9P6QZE7_9FUNG|nr:hypothetical protein BGZ99_001013 [Dissophora globulifera]
MDLESNDPEDVTYNVVGFPDTDGGSFGVLIDGKITKLSTSPDTFPLWSGTAPGASVASNYQYVKLSKQGTLLTQEPFLRSLQNGSAKSTVNEFFLRQVTQTALPELPQVFDDVRPKPSKAFDHSQIATIHLTPDPNKFADMVADPVKNKDSIMAGFRFISANNTYSVNRVKLKISGRDTRPFKKLSLRIKFDNGETFFNRPIIKMRSGVFDPTMIREKLYIDILNAVGVRTTQGAWVRVYVNGNPYGFYLMVEDIEPPFLRETMHHGNIQPMKLGSLYKCCDTRPIPPEDEATLQFAGSKTTDYNENVYENQNFGASPTNDPMAQLILFLQDLHNYDPTLPGGEAFWNSRLDLDGFLRCMAMEYLGGNLDAYWYSGNNYFMYFNPTEARWQFIPTDFDSIFSDDNHSDVLTTFMKFAESRLTRPGKDHPLVTKLIFRDKDINARFKQILLGIVNGVFNPEVLEPRISAYEKMITDEVKWDYLLERSNNPGKTFDFTIEDFHNGITGSVKRGDFESKQGIKPWIQGREAYCNQG